MMNRKDRVTLEKIIEYCSQIERTLTRFGNDYSVYRSDFVFRNACGMCILQIGELAGKLSADITTRYNEVPWRGIKATRNIFAHAYGDVDLRVAWDTLCDDIPMLKSACERILRSCSNE